MHQESRSGPSYVKIFPHFQLYCIAPRGINGHTTGSGMERTRSGTFGAEPFVIGSVSDEHN